MIVPYNVQISGSVMSGKPWLSRDDHQEISFGIRKRGLLWEKQGSKSSVLAVASNISPTTLLLSKRPWARSHTSLGGEEETSKTFRGFVEKTGASMDFVQRGKRGSIEIQILGQSIVTYF